VEAEVVKEAAKTTGQPKLRPQTTELPAAE
ncbi:uncharacterized protein METZ01_LOCUS375866, partial [marine metagenome]